MSGQGYKAASDIEAGALVVLTPDGRVKQPAKAADGDMCPFCFHAMSQHLRQSSEVSEGGGRIRETRCEVALTPSSALLAARADVHMRFEGDQ